MVPGEFGNPWRVLGRFRRGNWGVWGFWGAGVLILGCGSSHQAGEGARAQQQAGGALVLADLLQCPLTRAASWGSIGWGGLHGL